MLFVTAAGAARSLEFVLVVKFNTGLPGLSYVVAICSAAGWLSDLA